MDNTVLIDSHDKQKTEVTAEWDEAYATNGLKESGEHAGRMHEQQKAIEVENYERSTSRGRGQ